jgi:hypothetical protein
MKILFITAALFFTLNLAAQTKPKETKEEPVLETQEKYIKRGGKIFEVREFQIDIENVQMELQMITEEIIRLQQRRQEILKELNAIIKIKNE